MRLTANFVARNESYVANFGVGALGRIGAHLRGGLETIRDVALKPNNSFTAKEFTQHYKGRVNAHVNAGLEASQARQMGLNYQMGVTDEMGRALTRKPKGGALATRGADNTALTKYQQAGGMTKGGSDGSITKYLTGESNRAAVHDAPASRDYGALARRSIAETKAQASTKRGTLEPKGRTIDVKTTGGGSRPGKVKPDENGSYLTWKTATPKQSAARAGYTYKQLKN
jgi:hypothetical protein